MLAKGLNPVKNCPLAAETGYDAQPEASPTRDKMMTASPLHIIGWREWITLVSFGNTTIKAKVDTGAKTSALHAYYVTPFERDNEKWVRFGIHPQQNSTSETIDCEAQVKDQRRVKDSGGHTELRYVIDVVIALNDYTFTAEVTLTDRENMRFRMLLGRGALMNLYLVDSSRSFLLGGNKHNPPPSCD